MGKKGKNKNRQPVTRPVIGKRERRQMRKAENNKESEYNDDFLKLKQQLPVLDLCIRDVRGDGNCLFRVLSDQMEADGGANHLIYREKIMEHVEANKSYFKPFLYDVDFSDYCCKMRRDGTWAGNLEVVAASQLFGAQVVVHMADQPRWIVMPNENEGQSEMEKKEGKNEERKDVKQKCIQIGYIGGQHYASIWPLREKGGICDAPADNHDIVVAENKKGKEREKGKEDKMTVQFNSLSVNDQDHKAEKIEETPVSTSGVDLSKIPSKERRRLMRLEREKKTAEKEKRKTERIKERLGITTEEESSVKEEDSDLPNLRTVQI